jgi:hypothetical protein
MKRYCLKLKKGEIINVISAVNIEEATEFFAKIKQMKIDDLLDLFVVDEFLRK